MNEKKGFNQWLETFFAGKGFYIVLFLCVAVIGVSAYFLLSGNETDVEEAGKAWEDEAPINQAPVLEAEETPELSEPEVEPELVEPEVETSTQDEEGAWSEQQAQEAVSAQMIWPMAGETDLPYSVEALVFNKKLGDWRTSDGMEIYAPLGTQVMACGSGKVISVETDPMMGTTVVIEHAGGLKSYYSNLAELPTVYVGDNVMTGEVIGAVGTTAVGESAERPHLCFSMTLDGQSVNPADYLPAR